MKQPGSITHLKKYLGAIAAAACMTLATMSAAAQDDDPPAQAGRLSIVTGNVSIQPAGAQDWGQAYLNYPMGPGDRIFTDADGRAEIQVGQTYVRVGPNSDVTFVDFNAQAITFGAAQGAVHIRTRGLWEGQSLYVQTPSGTSTVTGPADFRVEVYPDQQAAIFTTREGYLNISGANDFGMGTEAGQALELVGTNPVYPQWLQPAGPDDLDSWSERRDSQIAQAGSYRYVSPDAPGAEDLDSYGQWTPGTEYGDMWFPNVPAGWQPYHNGHWVNREPWGWVWVEDEPWGYTPFHYGRWVSYHDRWGWIPGPREDHPVWSPALVVFAGGVGGAGVSAWFPLGPGEPYRPWYRCSPRYIDRVNITNIRETRVVHVEKTYVNVVNVNNVNNIRYVNRTTAVTAMRHEDFAAGRPVAKTAVRIDPREAAQGRVLERPQVVPTHEAVINRPAVRPVPVAVTRPTMINARGLAVAARPNARPEPPPQKAAPPPPALPHRVAVAPPPNVKMTPTARQALQAAPRPVQQPERGGQPVGQQPAPGHPVANPPNPAQQPAPISPNQPHPNPIPTPGVRPPAQPVPQQPIHPSGPEARPPQPGPPARNENGPTPTLQPGQPPRPNERDPSPQPPPPHSNERPAPISHRHPRLGLPSIPRRISSLGLRLVLTNARHPISNRPLRPGLRNGLRLLNKQRHRRIRASARRRTSSLVRRNVRSLGRRRSLIRKPRPRTRRLRLLLPGRTWSPGRRPTQQAPPPENNRKPDEKDPQKPHA